MNGAQQATRPRIPRLLRVCAVPIILLWVVLTALVNTVSPQLDVVGGRHNPGTTPNAAPSMKALTRLGHNFEEFDSNSTIMIVLEGEQPLGAEAHRYYDELIVGLTQDVRHVQHVQDFWGDPLTAAGAQSSDGKSAYVMVNIAGELGDTASGESVEAVRAVVDRMSAPAGVRTYVTGPEAVSNDVDVIGNAGMAKTTTITLLVITVMLLLVYRSIVTSLIQLFITGIELSVSRGVVAVLGDHNAMALTTFSTNVLTMLAIAAGTDYGIFLIGRYQEARRGGEDRDDAYFTAVRGVTPVVLGSGLTIAGSTYCLSFTRLPVIQHNGSPVAVGLLVVVAAALTMGPAVLAVCSRLGLLEDKRAATERRWRRIGTAVVRWPAPIFAASAAIVLVGMVALPGYTTSYNDRQYLPGGAPSNVGYTAAERHFSQARLDPDILMVEADHDLRNPADMLVLARVAKNIVRVDGIAMVQDITRPLGVPLQHSSIPFISSLQGQTSMQNISFLKDRAADTLKMADELGTTIDVMRQMKKVMDELADSMRGADADTHQVAEISDELRDHLADFDDFFRPMRNYFYWEKHCFDIAICWALRSIYESLDGFDRLDEKFHNLAGDFDRMSALMPQMAALFSPMIESMEATRGVTLATYSTNVAMINQMEAMNDTAIVMGQSFDAAKNDDFFYLPPEAFDNLEFKRGLKLFLSPDGKSARFFITHQGDPMAAEGISRVAAERKAAQDGIKQSSLSDAKIYLGGTAATMKDMSDGARYDLMIAAVSSLTLIFAIMLLLTRSLVAALAIVGTAASSIAASFGLSVLVWQDLFGIKLHWVVLPFSVIILLAVGSDYNLLLVSRFQEEIHAGLKTGIIRSMAGTGRVVTAAGLVFAFTMGSMLVSDVRILGQFGTTVCIGLLLDTLIVRSLLMPSLAVLLGRWFWWPHVVHPRGIRKVDQVRVQSPVEVAPPGRAGLQTISDGSVVPQNATT